MGSEKLDILFFAPEEGELQLERELSGVRDIELRVISSIDDDLFSDLASHPPDACILPLRLADGSSGVSTCLKLRGHASLRFVPVVGISQSGERGVLQAFYDVGVDCILSPPFNPDSLSLLLRSLRNRFRDFSHLARQQSEKGGVSTSLQEALDLARDAIVLFDSNFEPYYMNTRVSDLMALEKLDDDRAFNFVRDKLRDHLENHRSRGDKNRAPTGIEASVARADGRSFFAALRVKSLFAQDGMLFSYAMSINDLSELDQLSATLAQAQRTRSFGLLAAAGSLQLLEQHSRDSLTPLIAIEKLLEGAPRAAPLNETLTALLEFLDLVISPTVVVKVTVKQDYTLGMRASDLFQMLGHLILYAVEYAGPSGEVLLQFGQYEPGDGIPVIVHAKSKKVTPFVEDDYLSQIIQGQLLDIGSGKAVANKLASGLIAAEEVANRYRSGIQYRNPTFGEMKLRAVLPIDQRSLQKTPTE